MILDPAALDQWTRPEPRLIRLKKWLMDEVWTADRLQQHRKIPSEYLKSGEKLVNDEESLLMAAADTYLGELIAAQSTAKMIAEFLKSNEKACVVVFDGCSLREIPKLIELA